MEKYYRHFKNGKIYRLLNTATVEANPEEKVVVYQAMYGERGIWTRPYGNFYEKVSKDGALVDRFQEIPFDEAMKEIAETDKHTVVSFSLPLYPEIKDFIHGVFASYCASYRDDAVGNRILPWTKDRRTIHESNQVHRFLDAYRKTGENIVTWMELPVPMDAPGGEKETAHIDGFIADFDRKAVFFIEAKRFSRPSQMKSLKEDVDRIYEIAQDIYVNDQHFKGVDLLEYDSYLITLADIWEGKNEWTKNVVENWRHESMALDSIYGVTLASEIQNIFEDYDLLYCLMPIFNAEEYKEEVEHERHEFSPAAPASILTWSDEISFEALLAAVNKKRK